MQLFVVRTNGKTMLMNIDMSITGSELKTKIRDIDGIPEHMQFITFNGRGIDNNKSLTESGIQNHDTVRVSIKVVNELLYNS